MALALSAGKGVGESGLHRLAEGGAQSSAQIIPMLLALLAEAGLTLAEVDAIAVGQGPGAFTGLRTAISVAQGLAFGANKPVLMLDSLMLVAEAARLEAPVAAGHTVWVAMDARMDEIYAAAYTHDGHAWTTVAAPALMDAPSLNAAWQALPPACVAGSAAAAFGERLHTQGVPLVAGVAQRAAALLPLARHAWLHAPKLRPEDAQPLYLRDKVAQTTAERAALRLAKEAAASS
ncbi:MAG: tRNA (adenosine(37)-N6)-threonylcarbamoyltransferase complex dimerization subunit type 1 TsaB [Ideonella sp. MAG2]|nr:MAG: tRNA (adenosine(37)-N6)-threonylcarbamoyltransferase complex dimerization subunit type 1 TsaB [Ideonella sp. MAG2]